MTIDDFIAAIEAFRVELEAKVQERDSSYTVRYVVLPSREIGFLIENVRDTQQFNMAYEIVDGVIQADWIRVMEEWEFEQEAESVRTK